MKNNKNNFKQCNYDSHFDLIYRSSESIDFLKNFSAKTLEYYAKYPETSEYND